MINNNRQAGRRRGRGGQRQGGNPAGNGNRIDNRARGNANQLYEKYKTLAADAQRQGDRVNTEYYLQFADHYFRVLAESRSRFEEQNQQRRGREDAFDDEDEGFDDEGEPVRADPYQPRGDQYSRDERGERRDRNEGESRGERDGNRRERRPRYANDDGNGDARNSQPALTPHEPATAMASTERGADEDVVPNRNGLRPRRQPRPVAASEGETFDAAALPPALGMTLGDEGEPAKPRRGRPRRPAADAAPDAAE